jgi:hypothetical protein
MRSAWTSFATAPRRDGRYDLHRLASHRQMMKMAASLG